MIIPFPRSRIVERTEAAWDRVEARIAALNRQVMHGEAMSEATTTMARVGTAAMLRASVESETGHHDTARFLSDLAEDLSGALGRIGELEGLAMMEGRK